MVLAIGRRKTVEVDATTGGTRTTTGAMASLWPGPSAVFDAAWTR